ncbi:TatD family hydrolase [Candidatus Parcubacteria bacterium]|nr:TatD family hydrolase [Candidatus Parcubacteria bacterium]
MLVDTHAHLNLQVFEKDFEDVIKQCQQNNIWVINVGVNYEISKKGKEIAKKYNKGVYAAVGLHPIALDTGLIKIKTEDKLEKEFDYEKYKKLALSSEKIVAIGEIGLDYWYKPKTKKKLALFKEKQKTLLEQELKLAKEVNLPVIFHCRMAHQDLIEFLSENSEIRPKKAVAHGFVGNTKELQKYLDFGFYIGFNGIIFKTIEGIDFEANIKKTPLDKILLETDCPFLTPPNFSEGRNNPLGVKIIAQHIAKIKNISFEKLAEITTKNAKKLFKIK